MCVLRLFSFHTAEEVLDQFWERFLKEMDANAVVRELEQQDIISQGNQENITKTSSQKQQNEILFHV